jgi:GTP1/Obg family GTP-binding protein
MFVNKIARMQRETRKLEKIAAKPIPKTRRARIARMERLVKQIAIVTEIQRNILNTLPKMGVSIVPPYFREWRDCFGPGKPCYPYPYWFR